jgi:NhaP-type Na+/H+ or K+/H+ antiporter
MSAYQILIVLSAFAFLYSLVASRLERTPFNGALLYVIFGLLCGPFGLNLVNVQIKAEGISWLAELTLALVLFTDSANANLMVLRKFHAIPMRLLLVGLPLTILLGFGAGVVLFPDLGLFEVALLATMLAPTDAALGKAVVTNESVPDSVRESLNIESGLNDGICVPILLLFLTLAGGEAIETIEQYPFGMGLWLTLQAIGIGAAVGLGLGAMGSLTLYICSSRHWIGGAWLQIPVISLALLCFASAQWLGGSGFIAAFTGGMTFGALTRRHKHAVLRPAEGIGDLMAMLTWFIFGSMLLALPFGRPEWPILVYALGSLTVVRMLPVFLSVSGLGLRADTKLFLGWFGPRGLASVVFAVMVINSQLPGGATLIATTAWTILFSVIAHGLSANPLVKLYSRRVGEGNI